MIPNLESTKREKQKITLASVQKGSRQKRERCFLIIALSVCQGEGCFCTQHCWSWDHTLNTIDICAPRFRWKNSSWRYITGKRYHQTWRVTQKCWWRSCVVVRTPMTVASVSSANTLKTKKAKFDTIKNGKGLGMLYEVVCIDFMTGKSLYTYNSTRVSYMHNYCILLDSHICHL